MVQPDGHGDRRYSRARNRHLAIGVDQSRDRPRPLPRHLGHISYSVFCLHLVVLHFVMWVTPYDLFIGSNGPQVVGLTLLITLPLAELLYRFVELPAMRLRGLGRPTADDGRRTTAKSRITYHVSYCRRSSVVCRRSSRHKES